MAKKTVPVKRTPFLSTGYATALCVIILIAATLAVFLPQLGNGFTNWDDDKYILGNADITKPDAAHIEKVFSSAYVGNYQPVTMLVYIIEYGISGADPGIYHTVSLLFHLLNSVLVFYLLYTLCRSRWASLAAALLFAVHPLRVESVAWAAEQKDVICGMFFMISLLLYLSFMKKRSWWLYGVSLLSFVLALGSKPMAVSLPLLLFLLDYVTERKLTMRTVAEKVPYIVLAITFGLATMHVQYKSGIAMDYSVFPAWMRVCIPFYGSLWYIVKTFVPAHLSALYTFTLYPDIQQIILYIVSPAVVLVCAVAAYYSRVRTRVIVFGLLWYIVSLLPVLQIVRAGDAITADRYTYLPVIGLCCMAAYGLARIPWKRMNSIHRKSVFTGIVLLIVVYGAAAHERTMVWRNSTTLWNNVIDNYPQTVMAWYNRGNGVSGCSGNRAGNCGFQQGNCP